MKTIDQYVIAAFNNGDDGLFENLQNECGSCNMCCIAPAIDNGRPLIPDKPAGDACKHCTSQGCAIYKKRPPLCREYACLYLCGLVEERPDSNNVAWTIQPHPVPDGKLLVMGHCMDAIATSKDPVAVATMNRLFAESKMVTCIALRDANNAISYLRSGPSRIIDIDQKDPLKLDLEFDSERAYDPLLPSGGR